jgi:glucose/arabinose dehydrogenase
VKSKSILFGRLAALAMAASACGSGDGDVFGVRSEVVTSAAHPMALAPTPDGRLFFAEQYTGDVRVVDAAGELLPEPLAHVDAANWLNLEWGLTGLTLDPDFASNHFVYLFFTEYVNPDPKRPTARSKLVRFTDVSNRSESQRTFGGDFPETLLDHQGFKTNGSIHFGPDGLLYASVGDYDAGTVAGPGGPPYALDLSIPAGKMLRLNRDDGSGAPDNPFSDQPGSDPRVFAYGFRRGSDFSFHPQTGAIYSTDATDSCEELNVIAPGGDYGWPDVGVFPFSDCVFGKQTKAISYFARSGMSPGSFQSPVLVAGLEFVSGSVYPLLGDALLVCESGTGLMRRLVLGGAAFDQVVSSDVVVKDCKRDIATAPDGTVYYSNDTEIRRLLPEPGVSAPSQ